LLASDAKDLQSEDGDIGDLARALLKVLVAATTNPQRSLGLEGGGT
jgi:hypothetical protein